MVVLSLTPWLIFRKAKGKPHGPFPVRKLTELHLQTNEHGLRPLRGLPAQHGRHHQGSHLLQYQLSIQQTLSGSGGLKTEWLARERIAQSSRMNDPAAMDEYEINIKKGTSMSIVSIEVKINDALSTEQKGDRA
jgi:hypothetical protein